MAKKSKARWIQGAIKRPGAFTKKAKKAGKSIAAYASSVLKKGSKAGATTKRQAALAKTFRKMARNGKNIHRGKNTPKRKRGSFSARQGGG